MAGNESVRVAYVLYRYPQVSQTFVRDEISALRAAGVTVEVVSLWDPGPDPPSSIWAGPYELVRRPAPLTGLVDLAWWAGRHPQRLAKFMRVSIQEPRAFPETVARLPSFARRLKSARPDHIHTHFAWSTATEVAALAILLDCSCSITMHAKDIYAQPSQIIRRRLRWFDRVVTVCHFNVGFLFGKGLLDADARTPRMIPCGVATAEHLAPRNPTTDVVAVGRLVDKKGFDVLLRALATLRSNISFTATIVGDGPARTHLENLRDDLGLSAAVTFAGSLPHPEALLKIQAGRVFCLPSRRSSDGDSDAMPVVLREAMARGVPVIASRLAGIPESVDDEVGWLVEPGSVADLAGALRSALGDESESVRRGQRGHARALQRWRLDAQASQLSATFAEAQRAAR